MQCKASHESGSLIAPVLYCIREEHVDGLHEDCEGDEWAADESE